MFESLDSLAKKHCQCDLDTCFRGLVWFSGKVFFPLLPFNCQGLKVPYCPLLQVGSFLTHTSLGSQLNVNGLLSTTLWAKYEVCHLFHFIRSFQGHNDWSHACRVKSILDSTCFLIFPVFSLLAYFPSFSLWHSHSCSSAVQFIKTLKNILSSILKLFSVGGNI